MKQTGSVSLLAAALLAAVFSFTSISTTRGAVTTVSWWHLGENDSGVVNNGVATNTFDPVGSRTLTLQGAPFYSSGTPPAAAPYTGSTWCMQFFTGTFGTNASVLPLTNNFGIELWVKPGDTSGNKCLAYNGNTGSSGWGLYQIGATYQVLFGGVLQFGSATAAVGTWMHLALVRDNGTNTLYTNGVAAFSNTTTPNLPAGLFGLASAPPAMGTDRFGGFMDEVRVFTFGAGTFSTNDLLLNPQPPIVSTLAATAVTSTNAMLKSTVNPAGNATAVYFQYGTTTGYGSFTATNNLAASSSTFTVSNLAGGLQPETTYHFRVVATNNVGSSVGSDLTFTTGHALPGVTTLPATAINASNVTLNGSVNPSNAPTTFYFQYGLTAGYGSFSSTNNVSATNVDLAVSNVISTLLPGTTYHFRLVATNSAGSVTGSDLVFTTAGIAPTATTMSATGIGAPNATLNGTVNPDGLATTVYFQYGPDTNYANFSGTVPNPSFEANSFSASPGYASGNGGVINGWVISAPTWIGLNSQAINPFANNGAIPNGTNVAFIQSNGQTNILSTTISNLLVGRAYVVSFQANCRSGYGAPNATWSLNGGNSMPITCSPAVGGANGYYTNSATFVATADTAALVLQNYTASDTALLIDAFSIASSGGVTTTTLLPATNTTFAVSNLINGLSPATTYHFQIVASNSAGVSTGTDFSFTTPVAMPVVTTLAATGVTTNSAVLNGTVKPGNGATLAYFQYGTDTNYGSFSVTNTLAATNVTVAVSNLIGNLLPGTLYHCQLVASNAAGRVAGADVTFTTVRLPMAVTITNAGDSGPGTLRQAILSSVPGDTILFGPGLSGSSIVLTSGQLLLTNDVTIDASMLAAGVQINGNGTSRIFQVSTNVTVTLTALTLTNGAGVTSGGGIFNSGTLTLNQCTLAGNAVVGNGGGTGSTGSFPGGTGGVGGTGGTGAGGAIYNAGTLTVNQCTLAANQAKGGTGGTGGNGGAGFVGRGGNGGTGGTGGMGAGGAIYSTGTLTVNQCTLAANTCSGGNGGGGGGGGGGSPNGNNGNPGGSGSGTAGGIYQAGTLNLFNSIVTDNSPDNIVGSITAIGNNLTSGGALLSALGNNGGPAPTMVLLTGSPAFDAGSPTTFTNDQRGFTRVMGGAPDLGAVEMTAPNIVTLPASDVAITTATFNGTVNPNGLASTAFFQYGTTTNYGSFTSTNTLPTTNVSLAVTNFATNLQPATLYHFQIVASGGVGLAKGADLTFTTGATFPTVATLPATGITATNATLNGTVNPNGLNTTVYFQYGTDITYGSFSSATNLAATNVSIASPTLITNLSPGTLYHFQLVASNSAGIVTGTDLTFASRPLVPVVTTLAAGPVGATNATLNGTVNPGSGATAAYFQYGLTTAYGSFAPTNNLAGTNIDLSVSSLAASLSPATLYHFRVVAANGAGSATGADLTFTTTAAAPKVTTQAATAIGATNATLNGTVNPNGLDTVAYFQYGADTNYGSVTVTNSVTATNTAIVAPCLISNLSPGALYHFRLVAVNSLGSIAGSDLTFTNTPLGPIAITLAATAVNGSNATLNATVNPGNGATIAYFQYGTDTNSNNGTIANPSFEANSYSTFPGYAGGNGGTINNWTLSGPARIGLNPANGSPFADNGATPDGTNVAFIQSNGDINTLSTTISNLTVGRSYSVSFRANCRSGYGPPNATWSLNGGSFVSFTCSPAVGGTNAYYTNSATFTATSTNAALALRNNTGTDTTAVLDAFSINAVGYGRSATNNLPASNATGALSNTISGLQPDTTYYFHVVAINSAGTSIGADLTFTTDIPAPTVATLAATGITASNAVLNGTVNSGGPATAYFQYGTTTNYGSFTATNSVTDIHTNVAVSSLTGNLLPATLYHFRLLANNSGGTTTGSDLTFTSGPAAPVITGLAAVSLGTNAANGIRSVQLSGVLNPNGSTTASYFEYGLTTAYAATNNLPGVSAGSGATNLTATVPFSAGSTYHWRMVAANSLGAATSPDQTFSLGTPGGGLAGDLNGDGIVSQAELNAVYGNYVTNSPWLLITNMAGLGGTNLSFTLDNSISSTYTVQYSTNLTDWVPLGPAIPYYSFADTNAPALPLRYYRLSYP